MSSIQVPARKTGLHKYLFGLNGRHEYLDIAAVMSHSHGHVDDQQKQGVIEYRARPTLEKFLPKEGEENDYLSHEDLFAMRDEFNRLPLQLRQKLHGFTYYAMSGAAKLATGDVVPYITAMDGVPFVGFAAISSILEDRDIIGRLNKRRAKQEQEPMPRPSFTVVEAAAIKKSLPTFKQGSVKRKRSNNSKAGKKSA